MPRVNRLARAVEHPNPIVGCIMVIQEKIQFLDCSFLRCRCPEYEAQLVQLRADLSELRELYQAQRTTLRRLQVHGQETLASFRRRITSLLQANSMRLALHSQQERAFQEEIWALRSTVLRLKAALRLSNIGPPPPHTAPWRALTHTRPARWSLSTDWVSQYPGLTPEYNPNNPSEERRGENVEEEVTPPGV
jgi:hypothetical protein